MGSSLSVHARIVFVLCVVAAAHRGHRYLSRKEKKTASDEKSQQSEGSTTPMSTPADTPAGEFPLALHLAPTKPAGGDRSLEEDLRLGENGIFKSSGLWVEFW